MPEELANLLIRVSAVGFDEVENRLRGIEATITRIGAASGFTGVSTQLDQISRYLKDMHGDLGQMALAQDKANKATERGGNEAERTSQKMGGLEKAMTVAAKAAALFWTAVSIPKKFMSGMERIAAFNQQLNNLAVTANTSKEELRTLGSIVEGFGGSRQGLAGTMSSFRSSMHGLRMGRGGGNVMEVATMYGLDIRGSGPSGLATETELLRNVAALFTKLGDSPLAKAQKLDIKQLLGLDAGTFEMLSQGVQEFDKSVEKAAQKSNEMASANEAQRQINKRKAEVDKAWEEAELKMLEAAKPVIDAFYDVSLWVAKTAKEYPGLIALLKGLGEVVGTVAAAFVGLKTIMKLLGLGGNAAAGAAAGKAAGGIVARGAGAAAGKAAGGLLGAAFGLVADGANLVQNQILIHYLTQVESHITAWHEEWRVFTLMANALKNGLSFEKADKLLEGAGIDPNMRKMWVDAGAHARKTQDYVLEVNRDEYNRREKAYANKTKAQEGGGVSIAKIDIIVNSNASDAARVAEEVREELYRQINEAVEIASQGGQLV